MNDIEEMQVQSTDTSTAKHAFLSDYEEAIDIAVNEAVHSYEYSGA